MDEVNYIPGDEVTMSFIFKSMRGEIYNIEDFSSINTVCMLKNRTCGDNYLFCE